MEISRFFLTAFSGQNVGAGFPSAPACIIIAVTFTPLNQCDPVSVTLPACLLLCGGENVLMQEEERRRIGEMCAWLIVSLAFGTLLPNMRESLPCEE